MNLVKLALTGVIVYVIITTIGCSEYSTSIVADEIIQLEREEQEFVCEGQYQYYKDPYSKDEYCLPDGFNNMRNLHLYKVGGK